MRRFGWPRPALLIGYVLAPQAETYLYQAVQFYGWGFLGRPGVLIIAAITLISIWFGVRNRVDDSAPTGDKPGRCRPGPRPRSARRPRPADRLRPGGARGLRARDLGRAAVVLPGRGVPGGDGVHRGLLRAAAARRVDPRQQCQSGDLRSRGPWRACRPAGRRLPLERRVLDRAPGGADLADRLLPGAHRLLPRLPDLQGQGEPGDDPPADGGRRPVHPAARLRPLPELPGRLSAVPGQAPPGRSGKGVEDATP